MQHSGIEYRHIGSSALLMPAMNRFFSFFKSPTSQIYLWTKCKASIRHSLDLFVKMMLPRYVNKSMAV